MKIIHPDNLLPMDLAAGIFPLHIHLAYASEALPNIFGKIYADGARLWLQKDLAAIVLLASLLCKRNHNAEFILYDGLRTIEAQSAMAQSDIVKSNPQWLEPPRLLSPPGAGAHPRGMAIDIGVMWHDGTLLDMGTDFDYLAENSSPVTNPAHRDYPKLTSENKQNRDFLDQSMITAAEILQQPLYLLPQEWWDFRMPENIYNEYAPLSDIELPPPMRMVSGLQIIDNPQYYRRIFEKEYERLSVLI